VVLGDYYGSYGCMAAGAGETRVLRSQVVSYDPAKIKKMKDDRMGPSEIAKTLKIGRASVYRALGR
jgi:DNA invertase Pin-like site-specific DNA recombinase